MEQNKILNKPFKQIFHITDIKHNIIGIPFISKYIPTINIQNSKIHIKDKYTKKYSPNILPKIKQTTTIFFKMLSHLQSTTETPKPLSGNIHNFSIKQVHQYNKNQNKQQLFMSDFEFKPIHNFF